KRELASLRVMGFSKAEVGAMVYKENFMLSAVGLALGLPFGMALCRLLVYAYDTELYRLPFYIESSTFVWTIVMTVIFVSLANLAARQRVQRLDMVEVLKSRE
ncbi:MAG: ABC transporter permease, partial [Candidatus Hydrogenedentes bacterium]|nr:ABC transporter permease [Candidatus Hydrogenedentota bacterium]